MTVEPPADSPSIRAFKEPFIAIELLTCDVPQITVCKGPEVVLNCFFGPQAFATQLIAQINSPSLAQVLIR